MFYSSSMPEQRFPGSSCCYNSQLPFSHPSASGMKLQSVCATGIWITCGKDFEKETIISCIYHKFQMLYSGVTVWKQRVHWWNGSNFSGKFHLKCLIHLSMANSLMFIMSLIRLGLILFLKPGFLGHEFLGLSRCLCTIFFTQSATYGEPYVTGDWRFFSKMFWSGI